MANIEVQSKLIIIEYIMLKWQAKREINQQRNIRKSLGGKWNRILAKQLAF
jgi:hypothetical protein